MSFSLTDNLNEQKKSSVFDKNKKNNSKAYENLISNIKNHNSKRYYIDNPLREHLTEILESLNDLFGELICWERAEKLLRKSKVVCCQSDHPNNAEWTCFANRTVTGKIDYSGELMVKNDPDEYAVKCRTSYGAVNLVSQNTVPLSRQKSPAPYFITSAGLHLYSNHDESLGTALDKGMSELISKLVIDNINKKNGSNRGYLFSVENFYQYKTAKKLHKIMGDKLLKAYFAGNPLTASKEFDSIMGEGSWNSLMNTLDTILDMTRRGENSRVLQFKANQIIERYEGQVFKMKIRQNRMVKNSEKVKLQSKQPNKLLKIFLDLSDR